MGYVEDLLAQNERILLRQRQHWFAWIGPLLSAAVQVTLWPALIWAMFTPATWGLVLGWLPDRRLAAEIAGELGPLPLAIPSWLPLALIALVVAGALWGLSRSLLLWLNNEDILTDRRILQTYGVLGKTSVDSSLEKINDVVLNQPWLGRALGYGHLVILTASEAGQNTLWYLSSPLEFKRAMLDAKQARGHGPGAPAAGGAPVARPSAGERLAQLEQLRQQGLISSEEYQARRQRVLDET
jgi:uncharacterized membrane protein YdbT with pleckstrin-like domain